MLALLKKIKIINQTIRHHARLQKTGNDGLWHAWIDGTFIIHWLDTETVTNLQSYISLLVLNEKRGYKRGGARPQKRQPGSVLFSLQAQREHVYHLIEVAAVGLRPLVYYSRNYVCGGLASVQSLILTLTLTPVYRAYSMVPLCTHCSYSGGL